MNQARLWLVVNPTVGLPLLLGGVVTMSLLVHASVMTQTTWMAKFFEGGKAKSAMSSEAPPVAAAPVVNSGYSFTVTPSTDAKGQSAFTITVTPADGSATAHASIDASAVPGTTSVALARPAGE